MAYCLMAPCHYLHHSVQPRATSYEMHKTPLISKKALKFHSTCTVWGDPTVTGGLLSRWPSDAERVSMVSFNYNCTLTFVRFVEVYSCVEQVIFIAQVSFRFNVGKIFVIRREVHKTPLSEDRVMNVIHLILNVQWLFLVIWEGKY